MRKVVSRQQGGYSCQGDVHSSIDVSILGVGCEFVSRTVRIVTN
jgi:hypothetical protein